MFYFQSLFYLVYVCVGYIKREVIPNSDKDSSGHDRNVLEGSKADSLTRRDRPKRNP